MVGKKVSTGARKNARKTLSVPLTRTGRRKKGMPAIAATAPLYEQVGYLIRQRLIDGFWKPGEVLPSEIALGRELGVSQGTVRHALDDMVAEHLLVRRQGLGTFVSEHTDRRNLFLFFYLMDAAGSRVLPSNEIISRRVAKATPAEAKLLELGANSRVFRLRRVRSLKAVPTIIETVTAPTRLFPGLSRETHLPDHLYRHYQTKYAITVFKARERVSAVAATAEEAGHLGIETGAPLLEIERVAITLDERPVELRVSRCETSAYRFHTERG